MGRIARRRLWVGASVGTFLLSFASVTSAAAILLDFGPTTVSTADATVSPGHATGAVPNSEITWNKIQSATSAISNSNGSAATGVSVAVGEETAVNSNVLDFTSANLNTTGLTGSGQTTGVYSGTTVVKDGIFASGTGVTGATNLAAGARVDGLSAGTYTVFVAARNTNTGATGQIQRIYAAAAAPTNSFNFGSVSNFADESNTTSASFVQGDNYQVLNVSLTAGQSLYVITEGTSGDNRGFLNSVEIVPEPAAAGLVGLAAAGLLARRRRA